MYLQQINPRVFHGIATRITVKFCLHSRAKQHLPTVDVIVDRCPSKREGDTIQGTTSGKSVYPAEGLNYNATFSPVMQPELLRSLLAIAAYEDWNV